MGTAGDEGRRQGDSAGKCTGGEATAEPGESKGRGAIRREVDGERGVGEEGVEE